VKVLADYLSRSAMDPVKARMLAQSAERTQAWLISSVQAFLAGPQNRDDFDPLIETLSLWADALADQAAWPGHPSAPASTPASLPAGNTDYRNLSASPASDYMTGFAIRWDDENMLESKFGERRTTAKIPGSRSRPPECHIGLSEMRTLAADGTIEVKMMEGNFPTTHEVKGRWIANYGELRSQLEELEKQVKQSGEQGEKAWYAQVAGENKPQAAAAIRLLVYDLRTFLKRKNFMTAEARQKLAIDKLTAALLREAPKPAQHRIKPFGAMLHFFSREYVDYFAPSHIPQLLDTLDNRAMRSALALCPPPPVKPLFPQRDADLVKFLALGGDGETGRGRDRETER
jgi:hypothetical protein